MIPFMGIVFQNPFLQSLSVLAVLGTYAIMAASIAPYPEAFNNNLENSLCGMAILTLALAGFGFANEFATEEEKTERSIALLCIQIPGLVMPVSVFGAVVAILLSRLSTRASEALGRISDRSLVLSPPPWGPGGGGRGEARGEVGGKISPDK